MTFEQIKKMDMPPEWINIDLSDAVEILDNVRVPINSKEREARTRDKDANLFPYYGATGQVGVIDDYLLDGEHVLLGEDGAPFLDALKEKAYIVSGKFWVNNHAHILRAYFSNKYLCHYLNQVSYKPYVTGTTRLKLNQSSMRSIPVSFAPFKEQEQIAEIIEELFSDLDNAVENLKNAREQLKIYRQSILKNAFEGKLTNKNVKEGELPKGWRRVELGMVIEQPKYGTSKKCDYNVKGKGVLRIPNISNGLIDDSDLKYAEFDDNELEIYKLKKGDLLTIRSNGSVNLVGKCSRITEKDEKYLFAGYLIRLRPLKENILSKYLLYVLSSNGLRLQIESKAKSTSGVNNINAEELKSLIIPTCLIAEQQTIIAEIESRFSVCDQMEETVETSLKQAEALRQSILKQAFEGKLTEQWRKDHPDLISGENSAAALLAKIKAEKEALKKKK